MPYTVNWLTSQLAAGSAPMSYDDLNAIKEQGIDAIVNLCGEFCDLYQIEQESGFEVYYLPIPDECAPDMELMEQALQWLDEALYLKKKVLIHCRHGLGRTGTFISAYLLRRGLGLKLTEKKLKPARVTPGSYSQWKLLRKYGKQQGQLSARTPSIEDKETVNLLPFLSEYSAILQEAENLAQQAGIDPLELDTEKCCHAYFEMELIEAVHISHTLNRQLNREQRLTAMERAGETSCRLRKRQKAEGGTSEEAARQLAASHTLSCPLLVDQACILHANRPLRCRSGLDMETQNRLNETIQATSRDIFLALTGEFPPAGSLRFTIFDTVSGRFVQQYFQAMIKDSQG
ncbi:MAG: dual specificity protein phosphatase family protein [Desulfocapsaceae bacterium]|nr:dual specificity protein phosphatase family protein [Desulfocapsaceae bacterium]